MSTSAISSQGVQFARDQGGSPSSYTLVGEVTSFSGPSGQLSIIDASHLDSNFAEKLPGIIDEGQFTLEMNCVAGGAQQVGLRQDRENRTLRGFQLTLTDTASTKLSFFAYVTQFSIAGGVNEKVAASVTLEISGEVDWGV